MTSQGLQSPVLGLGTRLDNTHTAAVSAVCDTQTPISPFFGVRAAAAVCLGGPAATSSLASVAAIRLGGPETLDKPRVRWQRGRPSSRQKNACGIPEVDQTWPGWARIGDSCSISGLLWHSCRPVMVATVRKATQIQRGFRQEC